MPFDLPIAIPEARKAADEAAGANSDRTRPRRERADEKSDGQTNAVGISVGGIIEEPGSAEHVARAVRMSGIAELGSS
jgi:hypothetical protein